MANNPAYRIIKVSMKSYKAKKVFGFCFSLSLIFPMNAYAQKEQEGPKGWPQVCQCPAGESLGMSAVNGARAFVNLLATYQSSTARSQFISARKSLKDSALEKFDKEIMGTELKEIEKRKLSRTFFVNTLKISSERMGDVPNALFSVHMPGIVQGISAEGRASEPQALQYDLKVEVNPANGGKGEKRIVDFDMKSVNFLSVADEVPQGQLRNENSRQEKNCSSQCDCSNTVATDEQFINTAAAVVSLFGDFHSSFAGSRFEELRKHLLEPALSQIETQMMGNESSIIWLTKRSQVNFLRPSKIKLQRLSEQEEPLINVRVPVTRQIILGDKTFPPEELYYDITMPAAPVKSCGGAEIKVKNISLSRIK